MYQLLIWERLKIKIEPVTPGLKFIMLVRV